MIEKFKKKVGWVYLAKIRRKKQVSCDNHKFMLTAQRDRGTTNIMSQTNQLIGNYLTHLSVYFGTS